MHKLTGYTDRWSVKPGESIRFMVSSAVDAPFNLRFARHLCADPNPAGPGYREVTMPTILDGEHAGQEQAALPGSYGHATGLAIDPARGLTLTATIWPTLPNERQGLLSLSGQDGCRVSLGLDAGGAFAELVLADGSVTRANTGVAMLTRRWYDITGTIGPDGTLTVVQQPRHPLGTIRDAGEASVQATMPQADVFDVHVAVLPGREGHYNGKLERPTIHVGADLQACWDFSRDIERNVATDIGPHARHAQLHNLPTRAMTGANWTGAVHDWKSAPDQYGAIHFHDDDQGDLGWRPSAALIVPDDWPSGIYSAHISNAQGEDRIPFFVRPKQPSCDTVLLMPTYTYQVYGCYVRPGRGAENRERARGWGALTETPDTNPHFGLSTYNYHRDGSGVAIASMHRPMLDNRLRQISLMDPVPDGSGTGRICADSYITDWLDRAGVACDVVTDHDLHEDGVGLLAPYRVVIAGQHPEYHSERMMQALEEYLGAGGRLMYLGGNGFYWRAEPSAADPHAIEVRRAESGIRVWATEAGESYHAYGGGYGGLWRRIGRPAHRLVGNGFSVQGRHLGFPYRFTDAIGDARVAFMTEGLEVAPGAVFGDSGYMGGGAAGFEMDSADEHWGTPPGALVVAKGVVIHPDYGPVNEDMLVLNHPKRQEDWSCADMVFFETPAGGAVFSVGSMTYVGSLPPEGYGNTLARLTSNVLQRFRDPAPFGETAP
jgi:N,N-dimethylformamidase